MQPLSPVRSFLLIAMALLVGTPPLHAQTAPPSTASGGVVPVSPVTLDPSALSAKFDEYLRAHANNGFMGTVLVARDGKPLFVKGYGFANVEWQVPNAADTKFRIGSITKQFTSMLIMQLREAGKLKLEDSVCVFVAPCPDGWKPVTVHHLLAHTSGIPSYTSLSKWRDTMMLPRTVEQVIDLARELPLEWVPGEKWAYNNSGYVLLGAIIEKTTGKKYEAALQELILGPLGMTNTGYDWPGPILPKRASGYAGRGTAIHNAPALDMQQPYSAGAMYSTVEDLLKWDQALYGEQLLPGAAKQVMWTPVKNNYAYGWMIPPSSAETFGHRRILHTGGINGFSAVLIRVPEMKVTAIVLANNSTANTSQVARDLLAIHFGQKYTVPAPSTAVKD
jgi:CubicO group peptidase (beta-lactamase class C family)